MKKLAKIVFLAVAISLFSFAKDNSQAYDDITCTYWCSGNCCYERCCDIYGCTTCQTCCYGTICTTNCY